MKLKRTCTRRARSQTHIERNELNSTLAPRAREEKLSALTHHDALFNVYIYHIAIIIIGDTMEIVSGILVF